MSSDAWKLIALPTLTIAVASPMLIDCSPPPKGPIPAPTGELSEPAGGCDELRNGDFASIAVQGDAKVQGKVRGFLEASYHLQRTMVAMETDLIASCGELGKAIGVEETKLRAEADGGRGAQKVCSAVAAKISSITKANAEARLEVEVDAPRCYADINALNECFERCGAAVSPAEVKASCEGGEISGKCDAECKGKCSVDAGADCHGSCKASCSGACEAGFKGKCGGSCDGKCDGKSSSGRCEGTCDGRCDGSGDGRCTGTCQGKCSGSCEVPAKGKCDGSCTGGCSADVKEPRCSGDYKPPRVDSSCQAECSAKTLAKAACDPPNIRMVTSGKASAEMQKLAAALRASLPKIVQVQLGTAKRISAAAASVVKAGALVKDVAASSGRKTIACVAAGIESSARASASIDVNVRASASVSASASGT